MQNQYQDITFEETGKYITNFKYFFYNEYCWTVSHYYYLIGYLSKIDQFER